MKKEMREEMKRVAKEIKIRDDEIAWKKVTPEYQIWDGKTWMTKEEFGSKKIIIPLGFTLAEAKKEGKKRLNVVTGNMETAYNVC